MTTTGGWPGDSGVNGIATPQNGPEFHQDGEQGAFDTFSYLMN
jgi:hypothetical protein